MRIRLTLATIMAFLFIQAKAPAMAGPANTSMRIGITVLPSQDRIEAVNAQQTLVIRRVARACSRVGTATAGVLWEPEPAHSSPVPALLSCTSETPGRLVVSIIF